MVTACRARNLLPRIKLCRQTFNKLFAALPQFYSHMKLSAKFCTRWAFARFANAGLYVAELRGNDVCVQVQVSPRSRQSLRPTAFSSADERGCCPLLLFLGMETQRKRRFKLPWHSQSRSGQERAAVQLIATGANTA